MPKIYVNDEVVNSFNWAQVKLPPELCNAFWAWYDSVDGKGKLVKKKRLFRIIVAVHIEDLHFIWIRIFGDHPK